MVLALASLITSLIISIFFTTLFILIVLELKAISRSLSNIEKYIIQTNRPDEDRKTSTQIY